VKLGIENRKQLIWLAVLAGIALLMLAREFWPSSSTPAATAPAASGPPNPPPAAPPRARSYR